MIFTRGYLQQPLMGRLLLRHCPIFLGLVNFLSEMWVTNYNVALGNELAELGFPYTAFPLKMITNYLPLWLIGYSVSKNYGRPTFPLFPHQLLAQGSMWRRFHIFHPPIFQRITKLVHLGGCSMDLLIILKFYCIMDQYGVQKYKVKLEYIKFFRKN